MALSSPKDTLAYYQARVLTQQRDMSEIPVAKVVVEVKKFMSHDVNANTLPEREALWFYGMNHGVALLRQKYHMLEPLSGFGNEFMTAYHDVLVPKAVRAFYYLLLICTREARHNNSLGTDKAKMAALFGQPVANFFSQINGGEQSIHKALLDSPPSATIGKYCEALRWQFYNSKWSHGYGGKAWGQVTDCLCRFVKGEFSAEMMLDTNWTLCHNNGPIFNKGMLYGHYDGDKIKRILDVQRSGQTPEQILYDNAVKHYVDDQLKLWMDRLTEAFPGKIGKYVDWYVVEALGSVQNYPHDKKAQIAAHGMSAKASEAEKMAAIKAQQAQEAHELKLKKIKEAKAQAEKEKLEKYFTIIPNILEIEKIKRAA